MVRIDQNPFHVLDVDVTAARAEIERAGQLLLAQIELDVAAARAYDTPLGERERTPELVRKALAELRDPDKRLVHEFWAQRGGDAAPPEVRADGPRLLRRLGWRSA